MEPFDSLCIAAILDKCDCRFEELVSKRRTGVWCTEAASFAGGFDVDPFSVAIEPAYAVLSMHQGWTRKTQRHGHVESLDAKMSSHYHAHSRLLAEPMAIRALRTATVP